ncbi:CHAT domain-containing tetratricopeptide repeat protein [Lutibacter sp. TH_r2]|uniref:CHAT domain-containing protein n=1 Tax=Lutibacter sp. TH_r2 TaxID=3082083 RepID=UPI0029558939|nr:CHAT domain-containing tetratricopeptide repeat protein [Lutibacter sp. TH_r2]MDV7186807.1 CHAT domain-containing tetratricopeptide repeat protein [Lutibacter sp. TH_r2]
MLKKKLFLILVFFGVVGFSQIQQQLDSLKNIDNYAEYIYVSLDEFVKNPAPENLKVLESLELTIWRKPSTKREVLASIYFNVNYGYYLKQFGFLSESVLKYEAAKNLFESTSLNYDIIEYCLKPLANNYTRLGDFDRAEDILKSTIQIAEKSNQTHHLISSYQNLAIVKRTTGNYQTALNYLKEALKISTSKQTNAGLYSDMSINYLLLNNFKESEQLIKLSNSLNIEKKPQLFFRNYKTLGNSYFQQQKFDKALFNFNKALDFGLVFFGENNRENAKTYNSIAKCYVELQHLDNAENYYKTALETLIVLKEYFTKNIYAENTLKESFDGLAELYVKKNELEKALENYQYSFIVEKAIQQSVSSQNSKILMQQEIKNRSEACIAICYNLYQNSMNIKWIEKAFQFAENSKSSVLNEAKLLSNSKSKFENDPLIQQEQNLLFEKSQLTKKITLEELKKENANVNLLANSVKKRDAISNKLQLIKDELLKKYPSIYNLKSNISIKEIKQTVLSENQSLIEYFDGENTIYRFEISKSKQISFAKIKKDSFFKESLLKFIELFASERGVEIQNNIQNYTDLGFYLFEKLFSGIDQKQLIIIPDGLLNFIPFDALITEQTTVLNFEKLPYLLYKSEIQLAYSAIALQPIHYKKEKKPKEKFVGYFPIFEKNQRGLSKLNYTILEAESIKNELDGTFLLAEKATKSSFEKQTKKASIVHLSTHATAGSFYQPPAIEFYNETLYLPEIYGYNITSDLLVLSACETGLGVLKKGEGALSLARGFSYAGVKNVLVSLWEVNDKATSQLMSNFYKYYSKSGNKSYSIQKSKLDYVEDETITSVKKSPYYWASFVFIGEVDKVSNSSNTFYWLVIVLFLLIGSYFFYKKR